jgi:DNA polymerase III delta prime subunit
MINESTSELSKVINAFTVYKFIKMITEPFTSMDAYKYGIIDKKGNFLKKVDDLTSEKEKKSADAFHRLIINIKKLINKVPDPSLKAKLKNFPSALILLKDEAEKIGADGEYVLMEMKKYINKNVINIDEIEVNELFENTCEEGGTNV